MNVNDVDIEANSPSARASGSTDLVTPSRPREIENIQIILKTAERCNIACKYCYFFFGGNDTFKQHPPLMKRSTIDDLIRFLRDGLAETKIKSIVIGFHGGEPLLQRKADFDWACSRFTQALADKVFVEFSVQTNAMLIDNEWLDLFSKHSVRVGVSLDGPAAIHDKHRIDHKGRGTHDLVLKGLNRVLDAYKAGILTREPSVLCVLDPTSRASDQYAYFRRELGLMTFDFLLPEGGFDEPAEAYGSFLSELFDSWTSDGDPNVNLRFFRAIINKFMGISSYLFPNGNDAIKSVAFKVSSDGRLYVDDVLHHPSWPSPYLHEKSLSSWLNNDAFLRLETLPVPSECATCCWSAVCGGGHPWNRMNDEATFSGPSSLCAGLKVIYSKVYSYLISIGYPEDRLHKVLAL